MMALLFGAGVGLGVWVCYRAIAPRPEPIPTVIARLDRPGRSLTDVGPTATAPTLGSLEALAEEALTRLGLNPRGGPAFELTGRRPERHALAKLIYAIAGLVGVSLLSTWLGLFGFGLPPVVIVLLALLAAGGGFLLPDLVLRDEAANRRAAFKHALSAYLDLVNVLLAGGAGIETALFGAADLGEGWAFGELRTALDRSRHTSQSPWACFAALGTRLGINELGELAASVSLAGSHGARIRSSLASKADALRGHQVAETEAAAESATERMTIPLSVLLLGFLVLIAYPAIQEITRSAGA